MIKTYLPFIEHLAMETWPLEKDEQHDDFPVRYLTLRNKLPEGTVVPFEKSPPAL